MELKVVMLMLAVVVHCGVSAPAGKMSDIKLDDILAILKKYHQSGKVQAPSMGRFSRQPTKVELSHEEHKSVKKVGRGSGQAVDHERALALLARKLATGTSPQLDMDSDVKHIVLKAHLLRAMKELGVLNKNEETSEGSVENTTTTTSQEETEEIILPDENSSIDDIIKQSTEQQEEETKPDDIIPPDENSSIDDIIKQSTEQEEEEAPKPDDVIPPEADPNDDIIKPAEQEDKSDDIIKPAEEEDKSDDIIQLPEVSHSNEDVTQQPVDQEKEDMSLKEKLLEILQHFIEELLNRSPEEELEEDLGKEHINSIRVLKARKAKKSKESGETSKENSKSKEKGKGKGKGKSKSKENSSSKEEGETTEEENLLTTIQLAEESTTPAQEINTEQIATASAAIDLSTEDGATTESADIQQTTVEGATSESMSNQQMTTEAEEENADTTPGSVNMTSPATSSDITTEKPDSDESEEMSLVEKLIGELIKLLENI